eukprot:UN05374
MILRYLINLVKYYVIIQLQKLMVIVVNNNPLFGQRQSPKD